MNISFFIVKLQNNLGGITSHFVPILGWSGSFLWKWGDIVINIDKERFLDLKKEDIVFPIIKEYIADEITPTSIFLNLDGEYRFLLESAT